MNGPTCDHAACKLGAKVVGPPGGAHDAPLDFVVGRALAGCQQRSAQHACRGQGPHVLCRSAAHDTPVRTALGICKGYTSKPYATAWPRLRAHTFHKAVPGDAKTHMPTDILTARTLSQLLPFFKLGPKPSCACKRLSPGTAPRHSPLIPSVATTCFITSTVPVCTAPFAWSRVCLRAEGTE